METLQALPRQRRKTCNSYYRLKVTSSKLQLYLGYICVVKKTCNTTFQKHSYSDTGVFT